jgi:hypothetical protein
MTTNHRLPAIDFDLSIPPEDTAPLDEVPDDRLVELFGRAQAAATSNFLWACACVEEIRNRYEPVYRGAWVEHAGRLFQREKSTIYLYARVWRVWQLLRRAGGVRLDVLLQMPQYALEQVAQTKQPVKAADAVARMLADGQEVTSRRLIAELKQLKGRRQPGTLFGDPLDFRELRHEPINEQGVIHLFGMVGRELGFLVEAIGQGYPDCAAKRRTKRGRHERYEAVKVEFEFKARNFEVHRHDPAGCDLIVCWENDWQGCPVEVLELKSAITELDQSG